MHAPILSTLGLVASLVASFASAQTNTSTLPGPFFLQTDKSFNVFLQHNQEYDTYVPVISHRKSLPPVFELTDGVLTSSTGSVKSYLSPVPHIWPPVLVPLRFVKTLYHTKAEFLARNKTDSATGRKVVRLWAETGRELGASHSEWKTDRLQQRSLSDH